jgi:NADP-dependent 3-hydroxy acid dehydrogenase YdfG
MAGRLVDALREVCKANPCIEACSLDITDRSALERAAKEVTEKFGTVDCLVNNAGVRRSEHPKYAVAPFVDQLLRTVELQFQCVYLRLT